MAEAIGIAASAMTLAGLFKVCIEVFDVIQTYQNQELDLKKLVLRLNVEKCRLYVWGQAMGLAKTTSHSRRTSLDNCPFRDTVEESLNLIFQTFSNSYKIKEKYGCRELAHSMKVEDGRSSTIRKLTASFGNFKIRDSARGTQPNILQKTQWVVRDQKKFRILIQEIKELIDGLQDITKELSNVATQDQVIYSKIMNIRDVPTLDMVAEVCELDHPQIAYAASTRADSISNATSKRHKIERWRADVESEESDDTSVADLEALTVTELKYQISRLLRDRQQREGQRANPNAEETVESLKETIDGLERERDFYFSKLRDIELLVLALLKGDPKMEDDESSLAKQVQTILYATEEGFEIPSDAEDTAVESTVANTVSSETANKNSE